MRKEGTQRQARVRRGAQKTQNTKSYVRGSKYQDSGGSNNNAPKTKKLCAWAILNLVKDASSVVTSRRPELVVLLYFGTNLALIYHEYISLPMTSSHRIFAVGVHDSKKYLITIPLPLSSPEVIKATRTGGDVPGYIR